MKREKELFLRILKEYINEEKTVFDETVIDTELFYQMIGSQGLLGIFYKQCRDTLAKDSSLYQNLYRGFLSNVFFRVNRQEDFRELSEHLKKENIPFLVMKGIDIAKYYPDPLLRTMGDLDLIIHDCDRERCHKLMVEQGYDLEVKSAPVCTYERDVVRYEIHNRMFHSKLSVDYDYSAYFDKVWDYTTEIDNRQVINPEIHFLYIIVHMAKHISNRGYGLRAFLDLVFIWKNCKEMDWVWVEKELEELQLLRFTRICFALCNHWFGLDIPFGKMHLDEGFISRVTDKLFEDGLWGMNNEENEVGSIAGIRKRVQLPYMVVVINQARKKLFPAYWVMEQDPRVPFVHGRPWLLPFAWVYRWVYCFIFKREESSKSVLQPFTWSKEVKEREEYLKSWGL